VPGPADSGLQPERTSLAWQRTMGAMIAAGLLFLRWVPLYGWPPVLMLALSAAAAAAVGLSQVRRYRRHAGGLRARRIDADILGVGLTAFGVLLIGALALYTVLALPLR
jgi:uncharacterized membrane protein YidH (DUF202 family)